MRTATNLCNMLPIPEHRLNIIVIQQAVYLASGVADSGLSASPRFVPRDHSGFQFRDDAVGDERVGVLHFLVLL